ncbi:MFS transporter [Sphaerisporangium krabiense]|nr:MFS transporter [Sphaerisporangium krabiense]
MVTTLGGFLALLDSTIVNVALRSLSISMQAPLATIQWLVTAYLLALAAVLPASGWLAGRFGAKNIYILAVTLFTASSLACALSGTAGQLIAFRAVQGAAAGIAVPVAQMITVREAGPRLMARVMSVSGVPTILAPIIGPTIGGLLLRHAGWQWIFLINIPIGLITVGMSFRLLPRDDHEEAGRLDVLGLLVIAAGGVAVTYGLAQIGRAGQVGSSVVIWTVVGLALVALFVIYALRAANPLADLRLFKNRVYAAASVTGLCLGAAVYGAIILMPLYFQIVRHEDAVATGLLLIPQGTGVAVALWYGARLIDRLGSGRTALIGGLISVVATIPFVFIEADTSYWYLGAAMVVRGFGVGAIAIPATAAVYRAVPPASIKDATVQLNVVQRIGGSLSTALFAVVLQTRLDAATTPAGQAGAFGVAFWWVLGIAVGATVPTLLLVSAERRAARAAAP